MTEKALSIIIDAFEDIVVQADESQIEASMARGAVRAINRIMDTLASNGVALGFTKINSMNDEITIPDGALDALVSILAFRLWPKYRSAEPTSSIIINVRAGVKQMYKVGTVVATTQYPSTLPVGSGNQSEPNDYIFYPDLESTILSESNGSISLEDLTSE